MIAIQYIMCSLDLFALYHTHEHVKYKNLVPKHKGAKEKKQGREGVMRHSTFILTVFWHKHEHRLAKVWWQHLNILF